MVTKQYVFIRDLDYWGKLKKGDRFSYNHITGDAIFKRNVGGHDCYGRCEYGYGWWLDFEHLKGYIIPYKEKPFTDEEYEELLE